MEMVFFTIPAQVLKAKKSLLTPQLSSFNVSKKLKTKYQKIIIKEHIFYIYLISQHYYPNVASTASSQRLSSFPLLLEGYQVTVSQVNSISSMFFSL